MTASPTRTGRRPGASRRRLAVLAVITALLASVLALGAGAPAEATGSALAGESFQGSSVSDSRWLALGQACLTGATTTATGTLGACTHTANTPTPGATPGYLQLTDDAGSVSSSVLYNRALPSAAGVDVQFDTYQYGASGSGADGIGFFLTDGAYTLTQAGPNGGSLGYTTRTDSGEPGVAHGYLGVGFDVFGNNSNLPVYQGSGCPITSHAATPQSVVVRGPGNGTAGYCVLSSTQVSASGRTLDATSTSVAVSTLRTQSKRRVEVVVSPTTPANPYPTVTTKIDYTGTGSSFTTVSTVTMTTPAPATFKLGFSASTGGSREAHLIQGVNVTTVDPVGAVNLAGDVDRSSTGTTRTRFTAGDRVPYQFTVTATSASPLSDVALTDPDLTGLSCPRTALAVADSMTCTGTRTLTEADVASGTFGTTATVRATADSSPVVQTVTVTVPTYLAALGLSRSATPSVVTAAGQQVVFTSTITNTGTEALTGVGLERSTTTGSGTPAAPVCGATALAVGAATTCTSTYTATQADVEAGSFADTARATASANGAAVVSAAREADVGATALPALSLSATGAPTAVSDAGAPVTYSFLVTNTGNVTVRSLAVPIAAFDGTGAIGAVVCPSTTLAVGARTTCTVAYTATQDDVDSVAVALTARATGTTTSGTAVRSADATVTESAVHDASLGLSAAADPASVTAAGQTVRFTSVVTNTGNVTLGSVAVAPSTFSGTGTTGATTCASSTLAVGARTTCTSSYTITQADVEAGSIRETLRATASDYGSAVVAERQVAAAVTALPALSLVVTGAPAAFAVPGRTATTSFLVTNTGNLALHGIALPVSAFSGSDALGAVTCPVSDLAVGMHETCTVDRTPTQDDLDAGGWTLRLTATGATAGGSTVRSAAVTVSQTGARTPSLGLTATASPTAVTAAGRRIEFSFVMTDTGNTTLRSLAIDAPVFTGAGTLGSVTCPRTSLAPGDSQTCIAHYTATSADLVAGGFAATASASGLDGTTQVRSADRAAPVAARTAPALTLRQTADPSTITAAGQQVHLSFAVANAGNVPLSRIAVIERSFSGSGSLDAISCPSDALDAGATETCTAVYTATRSDFASGAVAASAVATGSLLGDTIASPRSDVTVATTAAPALSVAITASDTTAERVGQVITYSFVVTNTGAAPATAPALSGAGIAAAGRFSAIRCPSVAELAPGSSMRCTATYTVQAADVGRALVASAKASATAPDGTRRTSHVAKATVRVLHADAAEALAFTGAGPLGTVVVGGLLVDVLLVGLLVARRILRRRTA